MMYGLSRDQHGLYRDQGVVIRTIKLGETDRIVTIFTRGHGRIRAVAKGVRKPGSRFGARLEPASHVALQCYRGRELDVVTQVETIDANRALREHYEPLTHAVSMLEAVDQVAPEREPNPALYRMLTNALTTLAREPSPLVSSAFFWKLLSLEGFQPVLDVCVRCDGEPGDVGVLTGFDLEDGGAVCAGCIGFGGRRVRPETLSVVARVVSGQLRGVLDAPPGDDVMHDVERLAVAALEHHSERRLRSAALL
jgi:DNA repair protein RecO (recombination protein O)